MLAVHAYVEVTEAERGIEFYCEGLGLAVKRRLSPRWIELAGANLPIFLLANRPAVADLGAAKDDLGKQAITEKVKTVTCTGASAPAASFADGALTFSFSLAPNQNKLLVRDYLEKSL